MVELTKQVKAAVIQLIGQSGLQKLERALVYLAHGASMSANNIDFSRFMRDLRITFPLWPINEEDPNNDFSQISTLNPSNFAWTLEINCGIQ